MKKDTLHRSLTLIALHWRTLLIVISLVGFLASSFIPGKVEYISFFAFLWATSAAFILIDIRLRLVAPPRSARYPDMRTARSDILSSIRSTITKNRSSVVRVTIVGGRIRTISDMLRELKSDFVTGRISGSNAHFDIFTLDPDFLQSWTEHASSDKTVAAQRNANYAEIIKGLRAEVESFNQADEFQRNNITFRVHYYSENPYFYAYVIGDTVLYWGFFTWDDGAADFRGPQNQCFRHVKGEAEYDDFKYWLTNRADFFRNKYKVPQK